MHGEPLLLPTRPRHRGLSRLGRTSLKNLLQPRSLLLPALLLAALATIAVVQYRWIDALGTAEDDRLRQLAERSAENLIRELDGYVWSLYESFASATPDTVGSSIDSWRAGATFPQLLDSVILIEGPEARRWREADGAWQSIELRGGLAELQRRMNRAQWFRTNRRGPRRAGPLRPGGAGSPGDIDFPLLFAEIPALVRFVRSATTGDASPTPPPALVIEMDRSFLEQQLLESLIEHHLDFLEDPELAVLVRELQGDGRIIWPANASPSDDPPGWRRELLRLRPTSPTSRSDASTSASPLRRSRGRGPGGPGPPPAAWSIELRLGDGAFRQTIDSHRRQNLLLSGGVLLILAASIALLLHANHRANSLARRRLELIAGITHELNTPIAAMSAAADNLADGVVRDPEKVSQYGTLIRTEGRRLRRLVAQTLELSGLESGARAFELSRIDVQKLADDATASARHNSPDLDVEVDVPLDTPAVAADRDAIERVIVNLLVNAAKYAGGWARLSAAPQHDLVRITVSDRGPGIPRAERATITEAFRRGSRASTQAAGSGLGLHLAERLLERHGSQLELRSVCADDQDNSPGDDQGPSATRQSTISTGSSFSFTLATWQPATRDSGASPTQP